MANIEYISNKFLENEKEYLSLHLTKRETEVMQYIVMGFTAKQIGQKLNISYRTVEHYSDSIKAKLFCSSKNEIILIAIRTGLINQLNIIGSSCIVRDDVRIP